MEHEPEIRDWAMVVLPHLDYDSQLKAIKNLLSSNTESQEATSDGIKEISSYIKNYKAPLSEYFYYLEDERGEKIRDSIYQDAAHSMAAVGMLGPLIESLFSHAFCCILEVFYYDRKIFPEHPRFKQEHWKESDCHWLWDKRNNKWVVNFPGGVLQLAKAIELKEYLPKKMNEILNALFSYRNKMFHCGFEWSIDERIQFCNRIERGSLPNQWFKFATSGDEPWIFYLSNEFIEECLKTTELILVGLGEYVKNKIDNM